MKGINKKSQLEFPVVAFMTSVLVLLLTGVFISSLVHNTLPSLATQVQNLSTPAYNSVTRMNNTFVSFFDFALLFLFLICIIIMVVTSFLVDTHPIFLAVYVVFLFFTFFFMSPIQNLLDKVYESSQFVTETSQIPIMNFLRLHFALIIFGIAIICGIIVYAKLKGASGNGGGASSQVQ